MPGKKGSHIGGIRTLEDLRLRCRIDDETGCWVWGLGTGNGSPCVVLWKDGKSVSVRGRRAALELAGPIPQKKVVAAPRLTCTNSLCVNPEHSQWMTLGTLRKRQNADPVLKEKFRRNGVSNRHLLAKLTEKEVLEIRHSQEPNGVLCKRYGVTTGTVWQIRTYKSWRDLGTPKGSSIFSIGAYA